MQKWGKVPHPALPFAPRHYECLRATIPPTIDGRLDKPFWENVPWTEEFGDIEGVLRQHPAKRTQAKLLWDDDCLYIGAMLEEDTIWATQTERDSVIFQDNDFEIFLDPDGDSHLYCELEINALNTVWDLLLTKPYRDSGKALDSFDIKGLRSAVHIEGTLNQPGDGNRFWSLEIAMPWNSLKEFTIGACPPVAGAYWRINFSRVEWRTEVANDQYRKVTNPETGRPYPEDNWIWSPQGIIDMHYPEFWGFLVFRSEQTEGFLIPEKEQTKWLLRQVYYAQRTLYAETGSFTSHLEDLRDGFPSISPEILKSSGLCMETTSDGFQAVLLSVDGHKLSIREDGLIQER